MAFGPTPMRFLRRPGEAPLLSAGPQKAVECWSELGASFPLIFRPSGGVGDDIEAHRLEKAPGYQSVLLLLLLLLLVDLAPPGTA